MHGDGGTPVKQRLIKGSRHFITFRLCGKGDANSESSKKRDQINPQMLYALTLS